MHLHAVDAAVGAGEVEEAAQRHGRRVDQPDHVGALGAGAPVERVRRRREEIGEDADRPAGVGVGQRRAFQRRNAEMIMRAGAGVEGRHARPKPPTPASWA